MKPKNRVVLTAILSFTIAAVSIIAACDSANLSREELSMLQRIPSDSEFIFSMRIDEIIESEFFALFSKHIPGSEPFEKWTKKIEDEFGVDPKKVRRFTALSGSIGNAENEMCSFIQGDFSGFKYDKILEESGGEESIVKIEGYDVHKITKIGKNSREDDSGRNNEAYFYYDKNELIVSPSRSVMEKMLKLKNGEGSDITANKEIIKKLGKLKYRNTAWYHVPADKVMEDVFNKVMDRNPEFNRPDLKFNSVVGGMNINSKIEVNMHAYNDNKEQLEVIEDLYNGLKGMAILSTMNFPKLKEIISNAELTRENGYLDFDAFISVEDIEALNEIEKAITNRKK